MEREFTNENMEEFLRRSADGLRMRPSAKVWKGISNRLNRRRRRIGWVLGTSVLLTAALGYYLLTESPGNIQNTTSASSNIVPHKQISKEVSLTQTNNTKLIASNSSAKSSQRTVDESSIAVQQSRYFPPLLQLNGQSEQNAFSPTIVDSYFPEANNVSSSSAQREIKISDPLTIESVVNLYRPKTRKLGWQVYLTPTISYRSLSDNKIDNYAPHKPAFGFEMGVAAKYPISKTTKFRAGLQFNVNRYEIKTNYNWYAQSATIRLNDRNGVDVRTVTTNYNNSTGYVSKWLQNLYFQVSAPIGLEFKLKGDDKVQFGMASTLQPTYLLSDKAYLISSDYKYYAEMPNLVRRWNVNTSLETFVTYSTGHLNWQVGPQVRYQLLSSYLKKYPVKENLFDFGLKVGLSLDKH